MVEVIGDCRWSVREFSSPSALFSQPLNSLADLGIALIVNDPLTGLFADRSCYEIDRLEIKNKCYAIEDSQGLVLISLL